MRGDGTGTERQSEIENDSEMLKGDMTGTLPAEPDEG